MKGIQHMSDYKNNALVVQSNKFVRETSHNLKASEIKMFDVFVSCIDTMHPKNTISITKSELMKALGDNDQYRFTRETLKSLMQKVWVEYDNKSATLRHFIEKAKWFYEKDTIDVTFAEDILPMLVDLKSNFLQYSVADLNCLKSRYSMLLYKYVLSYIRQYKTLEFIVDLDELRSFLNLKKKYLDWRDFNKFVLKVYEEEINQSKTLPYLVRYEKLTSGKKVKAIKFQIRARTTNKEELFYDIQQPIRLEEMTAILLKNKEADMNEIKNRQADQIIEEQQQLF